MNSFMSQSWRFAAAVKIDPCHMGLVQDLNAFFPRSSPRTTARREGKAIHAGIRSAVGTTLVFCAVISLGVFLFAPELMGIFVAPEETEILAVGGVPAY